jgi:hypothetical protein
MHPLKAKKLSLMVDEQVIDLLFISLTGFAKNFGKVPIKVYKSQ